MRQKYCKKNRELEISVLHEERTYVFFPYTDAIDVVDHKLGPPGKESSHPWTYQLWLEQLGVLRLRDQADGSTQDEGGQAGDAGKPDVGDLVQLQVMEPGVSNRKRRP